MAEQLSGRTILVTGASRGIGRATAALFAGNGDAVAVNFRHDFRGATQAVEEICQKGGIARSYQADISLPEDCRKLVEQVEAEMGPIDVLVNNAAEFQRSSFFDISLEEFDRIVGTNLRGVFYLSQVAARKMSQRRSGCIIHLSSILARHAIREMAIYAATKSAIEGLTRAMALDLAPYHVRVNAIAPGLIETESLIDSFRDPVEEQNVRQYIPGGRFGDPAEIARVIVFLASDQASYINGAVIPVDSALSIMEPGPPSERTAG